LKKNHKAPQKHGNKKQAKKKFLNRRNIIISFVFLAAIASYFLFIRKSSDFVKEGEVIFLKRDTKQEIKRIDVEVANTQTERSKGLMFRKEMDDDRGMLFIFERPDMQSFWMKNTILPLDIMFIDSSGVIDTIYRKTTPYSERSLPSRRRVQFVVEVNGGWSDKNGLKENDLIEFKVDR
jgi:uncharacterized membrane protein (UPF0127 family)